MNITWESKDKQVKKEMIEKGTFTKKPTENTLCEVTIENVNITPDNFAKKKLCSNYLDDPPEKNVLIGDGASLTDRNIDRAVQMMNLNEKSLITICIPSFPETGNQSVQITMLITLKNYTAYKNIWEWSENEKYEYALKHKEMGIKLYNAGRHIDAFFKFSKACQILITMEPMKENLDEDLRKKITELRVVSYNNMAECHLHQKNYQHVVTLCTKVLNRDENNIKALYRRAVAYGAERNWEKAFADMKRVADMEPKNNLAKEKLHIYSEEIKKANTKIDNIMKKMFMAIPSSD